MNNKKDQTCCFSIEEGDFGESVLILKDSWDESVAVILIENDIHTLRLSESAGWHDSDLSFVSELKFLKGLEVYSWKVRDLEPVQELELLESIGIQCDAKKLDFTRFKQLKSCFLRWFKDAGSLFECETLEYLNIDLYPSTDLISLALMKKLKTLSLAARKLETLSGIEALDSLKVLDLYNCPRLVSLSGIEDLVSIRSIEIATCRRIRDLKPLTRLIGLQSLSVEDCGKIDSLNPIRFCKSLESIYLIGDTNIVDGKMETLLTLPKLKTVSLANRRHYMPKASEVEDLVSTENQH